MYMHKREGVWINRILDLKSKIELSKSSPFQLLPILPSQNTSKSHHQLALLQTRGHNAQKIGDIFFPKLKLLISAVGPGTEASTQPHSERPNYITLTILSWCFGQ